MKRMRGLRDETGSTLILTIFYGVLALVVILVVAAATSLYLERKRLYSLADAAALVGAEAFSLEQISLVEGEPRVSLSTAEVSDAVAAFLQDQPDDFNALTLEEAASVDGRSATVTLSSYWRPPVLTLFVPDGIRIEVTSVARSVFE